MRNILTAELFLQSLIYRYGRHPVYSDGATGIPLPADRWGWSITSTMCRVAT